MRCIADANVLLPLLAEGHAHQAPAADWWDACDNGDVGLSLPVRMALLRLLSNTKVMGSSVLRPAAAWNAVQRLIGDPRIEVLDQVPAAHGKLWYDNVARREPSPDLWTDALAGSACTGARLRDGDPANQQSLTHVVSGGLNDKQWEATANSAQHRSR